MQHDRDRDILQQIIFYCDEIDKTINRFGNDYDIYKNDSVYIHATALCVLQIGELTARLSDCFKIKYTEMPWVQIKALRNLVAHQYGKIDDESLWETITDDIPKLKEYSASILKII